MYIWIPEVNHGCYSGAACMYESVWLSHRRTWMNQLWMSGIILRRSCQQVLLLAKLSSWLHCVFWGIGMELTNQVRVTGQWTLEIFLPVSFSSVLGLKTHSSLSSLSHECWELSLCSYVYTSSALLWLSHLSLLVFETMSCYIVHTGLKLTVLPTSPEFTVFLSLSPKCW